MNNADACDQLEPSKKGTKETRGDIDLSMFTGLRWLEVNTIQFIA